MSRSIESVDLFCGAGGLSAGILQACDQDLHRSVRLTAVNHWPTAIDTHSLNHPGVHHICEPVENLWPARVVRSRRLHLLAAGVECTYHSNARGGGPCNEQSRSQAWQLVRWCSDIRVDNLLMENVREFINWGPLHPTTKRPIKKRKGEFFKAFCQALENMGYNLEYRIQCAADFGDPTSRERFILIARLGKKVVWPKVTHGPGTPRPWRAARQCIDWSIQGTSIFNRKKPLCENTLRRIAAGLRKFGGPAATPFLVILNGTSDDHIPATAKSVDEPMPTLTCSNHLYLAEPFVIGQQSGAAPRSVDNPLPTVATAGAIRLIEPFILPPEGYYKGNAPRSVEKPLPTITASRGRAIQLVEPFLTHLTHQAEHEDDHDRRCHSLDKAMPTVTGRREMALVEPIIVQTDQTGGNGCYAKSVDQPLSTVVSKQNMLLVEPMVMKYYKTGRCKSINEPLDTVTTKDRFLLVECKTGRTVAELDIRTRMLQPDELKLAHSFPKDFRLTGTKEDQTKQIGNSIPIRFARAHARAALS